MSIQHDVSTEDYEDPYPFRVEYETASFRLDAITFKLAMTLRKGRLTTSRHSILGQTSMVTLRMNAGSRPVQVTVVSDDPNVPRSQRTVRPGSTVVFEHTRNSEHNDVIPRLAGTYFAWRRSQLESPERQR